MSNDKPLTVLCCGQPSGQAWMWPYFKGFENLGHKVLLAGFTMGACGLNEEELALQHTTRVLTPQEVAAECSPKENASGEPGRTYADIHLPHAWLGRPDPHNNGRRMMEWDYYWDELWPRVRQVTDDKIDLVIIFESGFCAVGEKPDEVKGIPVIYYADDAHRGMGKHIRDAQESGATHFFVSNVYHTIPYKLALSIPVYALPTTFDEDICKVYDDEPHDLYDVIFAGNTGLTFQGDQHTDNPIITGFSDENWHENRVRGRFIELLLKETAFKFKYHPSALFRKYYRFMNQAKIIFNCWGNNTTPMLAVPNIRTWESLGVGRLLLSNDAPTLACHMTPWKHCALFHHYHHPDHWQFQFDYEELRRVIMYYLEHEEEREEIARLGHAHALKYHTSTERAKRILSIVYPDKFGGYHNPWDGTDIRFYSPALKWGR